MRTILSHLNRIYYKLITFPMEFTEFTKFILILLNFPIDIK